MHLINTKSLRMEEFHDDVPPYVILSHTWGPDSEELTFREVEEGEIDKPGIGSFKLRGCCHKAQQEGFGYAWIDTCCIDKTNLVELNEAINSMFRWYEQAALCYVYMSDVPSGDNPRKDGSKFQSSRWFRRGWTLQELLAPKHLRFYGSEWHSLGSKGELCTVIGRITGVPHSILMGITDLHVMSVAQRMSWAAKRHTKRKEDLAYCLLGIFNLTMPMIYGEGGEQAFLRLQEHIMKTTRDDSILAWGIGADESSSDSAEVTSGRILAAAPSDFANSGRVVSRHQPASPIHPMELSGGGLRLHLPLYTSSSGRTLGLLRCGPEDDQEQVIGIPLRQTESEGADVYTRPKGSAAVSQQQPSTQSSSRLIHIRNHNRDEKVMADTSQRYLLYEGFAEMNLELVEVMPEPCWDKERYFITPPVDADGQSPTHILLRVRHRDLESFHDTGQIPPDFVIICGFGNRSSNPECGVLVCGRNTTLKALASRSEYIMRKANGTRSARSGLRNLHVALEPMGQPWFILRSETLSEPPGVTLDATKELLKLYMTLELAEGLKEKEEGISSTENEKVRKALTEKNNQLGHIRQELAKLEDKRKILAEEERGVAQEVYQLEERQADLNMQSQDSASKRGKLWHELRLIENDSKLFDHEWKTLDRDTLLRWASKNNSVGEVQQLLDGGAPDKADSADNGSHANRPVDQRADKILGRTPSSRTLDSGAKNLSDLEEEVLSVEGLLLAAARDGDNAEVRSNLAKGANVEARDEQGRTPLSYAAAEGHEAVIQQLLEVGADIEAVDQDHLTPLAHAVMGGHEAVVRQLLDEVADIEAEDRYKRTPLSQAISRGHEAAVRLLLDEGANTEAENDGWTPLSQAVARGHEAIVLLLLDNGAYTEARSSTIAEGAKELRYSPTPLERAVDRGDEAIVRHLLDKRANMETRDYHGRTPLLQAIVSANEPMVRLLLDKGAEFRVQDADYKTPLIHAIECGQEAIVRLLVDKGVNINLTPIIGYTPLMLAIKRRQVAVVQLLLDKGAEMHGSFDQTPLTLAQAGGDATIVRMLRIHARKTAKHTSSRTHQDGRT